MKPFALALLALVAFAPPPAWAKPAVEKAAEPDPDQIALDKATVLIASGRPAEALPALERIIARKTAEYAAEKRRIYCARSMQETLSYMLLAAGDGVSAVAMPPTFADAIFYKGFVLVDLRRIDEAEVQFKRALELSPSNARYFAELAEISKLRQDWPTALATYQRADEAAALSPEDHKAFEQARAWRGIGFVLIEMGSFDEAQAWFEKCLALNPADSRAQQELDYLRQQRAKAANPAV